MLHTVNKSPFEKNSLTAALSHAKPGSAVLMIEDGVYGALAGTAASGYVAEAAKVLRLFVLGPDLAARGVADSERVPGVEVIDYDGFVDLAAEDGPVHSWL